MEHQNVGRAILSAVALMMATGGFFADWNRTHLFNPRWTPHAKFHDAWTILLGVGLGSASLQALWRQEPDPELAALLPSIYFTAQAGSYAFPGAAGIASEFPSAAARCGLSKVPEGVVALTMLAATAAGYLLSRRESSRFDSKQVDASFRRP